MKICNKCNHELEDVAKFCRYCGTKLDDDSDFATVAGNTADMANANFANQATQSQANVYGQNPYGQQANMYAQNPYVQNNAYGQTPYVQAQYDQNPYWYNGPAKKRSGLSIAASIFMILSCAMYGLAGFSLLISFIFIAPVLLFVPFVVMIPLAWTIPMMLNYNKKIKNGEPVSVGFKVCVLLFVNLLAGIFMLVDESEFEHYC